jgi:hypothetical protein
MGIPMSFSRKALLTLTGIAALAMPLAVAGSASASTLGGCTVMPLKPTLDHIDSKDTSWIKYETRVSCDAGRSIEIQDERLEYDNLSANDYYGTTIYNLTFDSADTRYVSVVKVLPDADGVFDEVEEMFHATGFQVTPYDGPASGWTPGWDESPHAKFPLWP